MIFPDHRNTSKSPYSYYYYYYYYYYYFLVWKGYSQIKGYYVRINC